MGLNDLVLFAFLVCCSCLSYRASECRLKDRERSRSSSRRCNRHSVKIDEPQFSPISIQNIREEENSLSPLSPSSGSIPKHRSPLNMSPIDRNRGRVGSSGGMSCATGAGASVRRRHYLFSRSKSARTDRTSKSEGGYDIIKGEEERGGEGHLPSSNGSAPLHPHHTSREQNVPSNSHEIKRNVSSNRSGNTVSTGSLTGVSLAIVMETLAVT